MANLCCALVAQSCPTLCGPMDCSLPDSSVHGDSPGKNTAVGCHALLQGYGKSRQCIKKLRHQFTNKGLSTQMHGFSSSHVWMWKLDHKEDWLKMEFERQEWLWPEQLKDSVTTVELGRDRGGAHLWGEVKNPPLDMWVWVYSSGDAKKLLAKSLKLRSRRELWTWATGLEFFLKVKMVFKASSLVEGLPRWS